MNREIKFRGFDTVKKRMFEVYGLGPDFVTENTLNGVDPGTNAFHGEDFKRIKIMQFAGLKDKAGKEIYEGDIIKSDYGNGFIGFVRYEVQPAQYWIIISKPENKSTYHELTRCGMQGDESGITLTNHTVIGNIYENPYLIFDRT